MSDQLNASASSASGSASPLRVIVLGGGVIGLTSALHLLRRLSSFSPFRPVAVKIISKCFPPMTNAPTSSSTPYADDPLYCSIRSGAHWFSFADHSDSVNQQRDLLTYRAFSGLAAIFPESGVTGCPSNAVFTPNSPYSVPWFAHSVEGFREYTAEELRERFSHTRFTRGFTFRSFMIDVNRYLPWLMEQFLKAGGSIEQRTVEASDLPFLAAQCDYLINCTGLGAATLVSDKAVFPTRGRTVIVRCPEIKEILRAPGPMPVYILPRFDSECTVVLGGTYQVMEHSIDCSDTETAKLIVEKCVQLEPKLKHAQVVSHSAGLRPSRIGGIRIEFDQKLPNLLHNYGHHGAGVQASWGCAEEVTESIIAKLSQSSARSPLHIQSKL